MVYFPSYLNASMPLAPPVSSVVLPSVHGSVQARGEAPPADRHPEDVAPVPSHDEGAGVYVKEL